MLLPPPLHINQQMSSSRHPLLSACFIKLVVVSSLLQLLLPTTINAQETTTTTATITSFDCIDPNNREVTHQVRRGDITTVCVYVGPDGDWNDNISYKRFSVNLIADEFSNYEIPGCKL